jgi:hypothetical protein
MAETFDQIQKRRQEKIAKIKKNNSGLIKKQSELDFFNSTIPEDQKPKGADKYGPLILNLSNQMANQITPILISQIQEAGFGELEKQGVDPNLIQNVLTGQVNPNDFLSQIKLDSSSLLKICPTKEKLNQIINVRNNLNQTLNSINTRLESFNRSLNTISQTYGITLTLVQTIDIAGIITSTASKIIPAPPGVPGIVTSTLNDLIAQKIKILFKEDGSPKLAKLKATLNSAAQPLSILSYYIKTAINLLKLLDILIKLCDQSANLNEINSNFISIANQLDISNNNNTYKGFTFEIKTVPFNNKLNRKKAVAINKSGIILLETELSFTSNDQVLINELKFAIDKNNLKAD